MEQLLSVENPSVTFRTDDGPVIPVQGGGLHLMPGRTPGLVAESGSGKSVTTKALMRLLPNSVTLAPEARIHYRDKSGALLRIEGQGNSGRAIRRIRDGEVGMILREPMARFSPACSVGNQMIEAIRLHKGPRPRTARELAVEMLAKVGLSKPPARVDQYAQEPSAGMRQRIRIARALVSKPDFVVATRASRRSTSRSRPRS